MKTICDYGERTYLDLNFRIIDLINNKKVIQAIYHDFLTLNYLLIEKNRVDIAHLANILNDFYKYWVDNTFIQDEGIPCKSLSELIYTGEYYLRTLSPCTVVEHLCDIGLFEPFADPRKTFGEALNTAYRFGLIKKYMMDQLLNGYDLAVLIKKAFTGGLLAETEESCFGVTRDSKETTPLRPEKAKVLPFAKV